MPIFKTFARSRIRISQSKRHKSCQFDPLRLQSESQTYIGLACTFFRLSVSTVDLPHALPDSVNGEAKDHHTLCICSEEESRLLWLVCSWVDFGEFARVATYYECDIWEDFLASYSMTDCSNEHKTHLQWFEFRRFGNVLQVFHIDTFHEECATKSESLLNLINFCDHDRFQGLKYIFFTKKVATRVLLDVY